ncbi:hypothetical protein MJO29_005447 [Puccinia striiformis f. sp. tritici]|nr:hypothetical protein MJO29_005447 [Puccinia striiformis f. sp. tritici]
MSVQRSPTNSGTRPTTRSTARINNNTREEISEDEGDQTLNPQLAADGAYILPALDAQQGQSSIIRDALSRFGPGDLLKSDGSNFRTWYRELIEIAFSYLDNAEFFMGPQMDSPMERVARSILLGSVDRSLRHELYDSRTSFGMLQILRTRFRTINRAAQLNRWTRLHRINISLDTNILELATIYRNAYADLLESGLELNEDNVLGLLLHTAIRHNTDLRNEFDNRVNTVLSWNNDRPLSFNRIIDILTSSQQRVNDRLGDQRQEVAPVAFNVQPTNQDRSDSIVSHPDNVYAQAARPSRPLPTRSNGTRACFRCGSTSHMISQCNAPEPAPRPQTQVDSRSGRSFTSASGFTSYYPIITPPNFSSSFNPPNRDSNQHNNNLRPADSYRPNYNNTTPCPSAREAAPKHMDQSPGDHPASHHDSMDQDNRPTDPNFCNLEFEEPASDPDRTREALLDTGATHHLTGDRLALTDFTVFNPPIPLRVATNGPPKFVTGKGTMHFPGPNSTLMALSGVLYCEHANSTLISLAALRIAGFTVSYNCKDDSFNLFKGFHFWTKSRLHVASRKWVFPFPVRSLPTVVHNSPNTVITALQASPTATDDPFSYVIPVSDKTLVDAPSLTVNEEYLLQLHWQLGHVSLRVIRRMIANKVGLGLPSSLPPGDIHCTACLTAKSLNKNTLSSDRRHFEPMDIWNVDLIGPFEVPSIGGGKYCLTIRDIGSGYNEVKIHVRKSEATEHLIDTVIRLENQTGKLLRILRSDNGGEFSSATLSTFLKSEGIAAEQAIAYHHYQNGSIERFNRTLQEMGRTLLLDSGLPKPFWASAFLWACHSLNRIPNAASGDITPFEKMFGCKPNLDRMRAFGTSAFVHIPVEKRRKLDDRAIKGIVIGHLSDSKGWCFWIPSANAFLNSAVAVFQHHPAPQAMVLESESPASFSLELGNFQDELTVQTQDSLVDDLSGFVPEFFSTTVPNTYKQAMKDSFAAEWNKAIRAELDNLQELEVWVVDYIPKGTSVMKARWVFAQKTTSAGEFDKFKARYVAKGYTQIAGKHFAGTFTPTATFISFRLILTISAANSWAIHSFDFVAAYLNSPIEEELWVEAPEGLNVLPGQACRLKKALYSTKQAARCWWQHLAATLAKLGYSASQYDSSVYVLRKNTGHDLIWVHVDDGIVTGPSTACLVQLEKDPKSSIKIKWNDDLTDIVGLCVSWNKHGFLLSQPKLISKILNDRWDGVTLSKTPLPVGNLPPTNPDKVGIRSTDYLSIVGSLNYVAVATRPDICFAVNFLARFSSCPSAEHWKFLNHLISYLANTRTLPLSITPTTKGPALCCYVDANWGGEFSRSTYGVIIFYLGCPIAWFSKRLATVAASTAHAEYMALGHGTRQTLWIRNLLYDMTGVLSTGAMYCDNQAAVKICSNDTSNKRTRHTDRDFYITNQAFFDKKIDVTWVSTKFQFAESHGYLLPHMVGNVYDTLPTCLDST